LTASAEDTVVAYISRNQFENSLKNMNSDVISNLTDYLAEIPPFQHLSKQMRHKIVSQAKKVTLPKGWTFNSNRNSSSFCLILSGNFQMTFGKSNDGFIKKK
jgi:hypothetical protein